MLVILLGLYIIVLPFLPQIFYIFRDKSANVIAPYTGDLAKSEGSTATSPPPKENRLVIPSIGVNEIIFEGSNIGLIRNGGTWHRPNSANPTQDNNTVIVGHRFYGNNTATFYHLDKVLVGQKLALYWEGEEFLYEVVATKVVDATALDIEGPTEDKVLTLYTCDPIWTAKNRLVIIAKPVESEVKP